MTELKSACPFKVKTSLKEFNSITFHFKKEGKTYHSDGAWGTYLDQEGFNTVNRLKVIHETNSSFAFYSQGEYLARYDAQEKTWSTNPDIILSNNALYDHLILFCKE